MKIALELTGGPTFYPFVAKCSSVPAFSDAFRLILKHAEVDEKE